MFWLQLGSAVTGLAAVLWFRSAAGKPPPMTYDGVARQQAFLEGAGRLNSWAAGATAVSVLLVRRDAAYGRGGPADRVLASETLLW